MKVQLLSPALNKVNSLETIIGDERSSLFLWSLCEPGCLEPLGAVVCLAASLERWYWRSRNPDTSGTSARISERGVITIQFGGKTFDFRAPHTRPGDEIAPETVVSRTEFWILFAAPPSLFGLYKLIAFWENIE